jgi:predicted transposase/invertase (TIGR01784 family)
MAVRTKSTIRPRIRTNLPEILSPTVDIIFKILFGDERNKDILADFLSAVLEFKVTPGAITIIDPHLERDNEDDKLGILDVKLKLRSGKYINVEMQVGKLKNIHKRIEYYISTMLVRQLKKSHKYERLLPVVAIIVSKETILRETERFHCEFSTLEKTDHFELHGLRTIHTLELSKLPEGVSGKLEDWLKFINSEKKEEYMAVAQKSKPMKRALEVLEEASADDRIRDLYFYRKLAKMDEQARMDYAVDEAAKKAMEKGIEKGIEKGMEKGMEKGRSETMAEVFALIDQGIPPDEIKKIMGSPWHPPAREKNNQTARQTKNQNIPTRK